MTDLDYTALDPGIRRTVRWLRSLGYETCGLSALLVPSK